jgi:transposase InsO family protein
LNGKVLSFFVKEQLPMLRILTDRSSEYCGRAETHGYQLYLAISDIEHSKTKMRSLQTNGICECFYKTILQEFYQVALRRNLYNDLVILKKNLDEWLDDYNNQRTHQGKIYCGRTPVTTLMDGKTIWKEKFIG